MYCFLDSYGIDYRVLMKLGICIGTQQVNEEANEKVLELEQKYNEIRRPVYLKRNDVIKTIPDFWLTAVSDYLYLRICFMNFVEGLSAS